jgi:hypothetical protein
MMKTFCGLSLTLLAILLAASLWGCGGNQATTPVVSPIDEGTSHAHATEGPHGGHLIELGNEAYHAELVHDDAAGTVTIYVLDSTAENSLAIDAKQVTINVTHDGEGEQFTLAATPQSSDTAGKSSRFVSSDEELATDLDAGGHAAQLVVVIGGQQYRGQIDHDHEGGEHNHPEDEADHD